MDQLQQKIVDDLLYPAWRGIDDGYKRKYARSIWQQFEDNIRSAAYTSSVARFIDMLSQRLGITFRAGDVASVAGAAFAGKEALKCLREDTTLLVLMVRLKNDERKELALKNKEDEADENVRVRDENDGALFDIA